MLRALKILFHQFEEILCGFFLLLMVSIVIVNVLLRYLFDYSLFWAEEVATISFVWAVFLGASAVYKNKMDIGIDVLITKTPPVIEKSVRVTVDFLLLLINGYIFYMSVVFTWQSYQKPTAVLGVSSSIVNSALIVGFGLITFHTLRFMARDAQSRFFRKKEQVGL